MHDYNTYDNPQYGSFEFTLGQRTITPFLEGKFKGNTAGFVIGTIFMIPPFIWWFAFKNRKSLKVKNSTNINSYEIVYRKMATHIFLWSSLTFLLLSSFSIVLFYWNIPGYIFIVPFWITVLAKAKKKILIATLVYSAIVNVAVVIHFAILPLTSFIDGAEDRDGAHHYGWSTIGNEIINLTKDSPEEFQILTSSYRTASLLSFQLDRSDIYCYSPRFDQFDYWTKDIKYEKQKALILTDDWKKLNGQLKKISKDIVLIDTIRIEKFGYKIKDYYLYNASIRDEFISAE